MDGGPAEDAADDAFAAMNIHTFGWGYLVVTSAITNYMDEAIVSDIVHEPTDFIGMAFDYDPVIFSWIYDAVGCSVIVQSYFIYEWADVFQP
jgi:hypothetical protein